MAQSCAHSHQYQSVCNKQDLDMRSMCQVSLRPVRRVIFISICFAWSRLRRMPGVSCLCIDASARETVAVAFAA